MLLHQHTTRYLINLQICKNDKIKNHDKQKALIDIATYSTRAFLKFKNQKHF